ncbi:Nn.00g108790.m01.CDS01 [Neocucurbitaria sp. VM-36]
MKHSILALALIGAVAARPAAIFKKREVPQEHSHENIVVAVNDLLFKNNPDDIQDAVFGLLGAAAAANGAGDIADPDCLQQATADQAFSNAKELGDVEGMTNALIFRALERNTGKVGLASVPCESIVAVNPEIAALQQHQDPAGEGAQALNKEIAAELARQIAAIGGDPLQANLASTFEPGQLDDPTAAGNTCNDENDDAGCINSLGLRIDDLSEDEVAAAVADVNQAAGNATLVAGNATAVAGDDAQAGNDAQAAFGGCDPTIVFGAPSDGRQQDAFEPADLATFNHGSALNIAVISNFICSQISNKCSVNAAAANLCDTAAAAASGLQGLQAANAFNLALGF